MGTLSKRPLRDFGIDIKDRIEDFRSSVGSKLDKLHDTKVSDVAQKVGVPPSALPWFALAGASFVGALLLKAFGRNHLSLFVGQWVPTFVVLGMHADKLPARAT